jgi:AraC-like DNA-binding protein
VLVHRERADVSDALMPLIERTLEIEAQVAGVTPIARPHGTGWRRVPGMVTAHLAGCAGRLEREGHAAVMTARGGTICVPAGVHHRFTLTTPRGVSRWSHLRFSVLTAIDPIALFAPPPTFSGALAERIGDLNAELTAIRDRHTLQAAAQRKALAFDLLQTIAAVCPEPERRLSGLREIQRLAPALARIDERLGDPQLDLAELAAVVGLSLSRFQAVFKAMLGVAPSRFIQRRRMQRAEQLLVGTPLKVHEVAARCGWPDQFHFSHLFKRLHGVSPQAYRAQALSASL